MTPCSLPIDPALGSLSRAARRLLGKRNVLDADSADFAKNRHFDRLHGGDLDGPQRPVVLFTACPHDLLDRGSNGAVPAGVAKWAVSPPPATVDGQPVPLLGTRRAAARPQSWDDLAAAARSMLAVERASPALYGGKILMYRDLQPSGLCEWGASGLFIGPSDWGSTELRLSYMAGEFRVFLEHLAPLYARIGMDGPFVVFLSIRNSNMLVLGGRGGAAPGRRPCPGQNRPPALADHATGSANIQWMHDFGSAGGLAGGGAAQAAAEMEAHVRAEYGMNDPGCCMGGAFPYDLFRRARAEALGRYRT